VWCIAYDCDYDIKNALPGTSFHRIPLVRNPELAKQVKFVIGPTRTHAHVCTVDTKPLTG